MNFSQKFLIFFFFLFGAALFLIFSSKLNAQTQETFDGNWWNEVPAEFQLGFILGYQEGVKVALGEIVARDKNLPGSLENLSTQSLEDQFHLKIPFSCSQITGEIDRFYQKDINKPIHIYSAITIALMKLQNFPEETIRKAISQYRKANDLFEKGGKGNEHDCSGH